MKISGMILAFWQWNNVQTANRFYNMYKDSFETCQNVIHDNTLTFCPGVTLTQGIYLAEGKRNMLDCAHYLGISFHPQAPMADSNVELSFLCCRAFKDLSLPKARSNLYAQGCELYADMYAGLSRNVNNHSKIWQSMAWCHVSQWLEHLNRWIYIYVIHTYLKRHLSFFVKVLILKL